MNSTLGDDDCRIATRYCSSRQGNAFAVQVQPRGLRQRAQRFVRALHHHIGAETHRRGRQIGMKGQVRAVRFVDEQRDVVIVRQRRPVARTSER